MMLQKRGIETHFLKREKNLQNNIVVCDDGILGHHTILSFNNLVTYRFNQTPSQKNDFINSLNRQESSGSNTRD